MHQPVMLKEVIEGLRVQPGGCFVDATCGSGGHASAIAEKLCGRGFLVVCDRDEDALARTMKRLNGFTVPVCAVHAAFAGIDNYIRERRLPAPDGILMDLGVSSEQLDAGSRGFSFRASGPLDMRMDRRQRLTAEKWLENVEQAELQQVLREYGDEKRARSIAAAIIRARESGALKTTEDLAVIIEKTVSTGGRIHPATRTFQALRMIVNDEIEQLRSGLGAGLRVLAPGGRMAVISFHSGEDRIVKNFFREHEGRDEALAEGGSCWEGSLPRGRRVTRRPLQPSAEETNRNPRARSSKLRIFEKTTGGD